MLGNYLKLFNDRSLSNAQVWLAEIVVSIFPTEKRMRKGSDFVWMITLDVSIEYFYFPEETDDNNQKLFTQRAATELF